MKILISDYECSHLERSQRLNWVTFILAERDRTAYSSFAVTTVWPLIPIKLSCAETSNVYIEPHRKQWPACLLSNAAAPDAWPTPLPTHDVHTFSPNPPSIPVPAIPAAL
jgi:hypothetical protein